MARSMIKSTLVFDDPNFPAPLDNFLLHEVEAHGVDSHADEDVHGAEHELCVDDPKGPARPLPRSCRPRECLQARHLLNLIKNTLVFDDPNFPAH